MITTYRRMQTSLLIGSPRAGGSHLHVRRASVDKHSTITTTFVWSLNYMASVRRWDAASWRPLPATIGEAADGDTLNRCDGGQSPTPEERLPPCPMQGRYNPCLGINRTDHGAMRAAEDVLLSRALTISELGGKALPVVFDFGPAPVVSWPPRNMVQSALRRRGSRHSASYPAGSMMAQPIRALSGKVVSMLKRCEGVVRAVIDYNVHGNQ